ncbi:MAG TPA: hypothetical protein VF842_04990 [Flavobacterium sp.]
MKKVIALTIVFISILVSCKKEKSTAPAPAEKKVIDEPVSEECYRAIVKKDTISMSLTIKGNQLASGKLSYNFFEKDKSFGTLVGKVKGDTLFADYAFMSEGLATLRQVAFLKKGNTYIEGYGEVVDDSKGKVIFKDPKQLKFEGNIVLSKVDCQK